MAGKSFAQINASLLNSNKIKQLNHADNGTCVCVRLTPLCSFGAIKGNVRLFGLDAPNLRGNEISRGGGTVEESTSEMSQREAAELYSASQMERPFPSGR